MVIAQTIETDTIGGTTYDWQANGCTYRMIYNDTVLGVHATWMFSASNDPAFPDRSMRYNFYDNSTNQWSFNQGSNFMDWGVNVYNQRTGYGSLDVNPQTGCAYISGHQGSSIYPIVARDVSPGTGTFEECSGTGTPSASHLWPIVALDANGKSHIACLDDPGRNSIFYTTVDPWCTWGTPVQVSVTNPMFSDQQMAVSRRSSKILIDWIYAESGVNPPDPLYYRLSTDGGTTWGDEIQLEYPPAFTPGSDTMASFHLSGGSVIWDNNDNFHITTNIMPVTDQGYIIPAEIWDYCPANTPAWNKITRAVCKDSNLMAAVGYNTMYAARPQLAQDKDNNFYCVWEQFDSSNVEEVTSLLRSDVFGAASRDGGLTWTNAVKLTVSDASSHRFPSVAQLVDDNLHIVYEQDLQAGFIVQTEGSFTNNPIVYMSVPKTIFVSGVAEGPSQPRNFTPKLAVSPNPFRTSATISYNLSRSGSAALRVYDASGNLVRTLIDGNLPAGAGSVVWNGKAHNGQAVSHGIYFARLETPNQTVSQKVVFSH